MRFHQKFELPRVPLIQKTGENVASRATFEMLPEIHSRSHMHIFNIPDQKITAAFGMLLPAEMMPSAQFNNVTRMCGWAEYISINNLSAFFRTAFCLFLACMGIATCLSTAANADILYPSIKAKASSEFPGWPVSNGIDSSLSTCWSSSLHTSANNKEWYDIDLGGLKRVNYLKLTPRMISGLPRAFPTSVTVFWGDGTNWNQFDTLAWPLPQSADVCVKLPKTVVCDAIRIVTTTLSMDDCGNYVFQMANFQAGYIQPKVYVGGDTFGWNDMTTGSEKWAWTRANADGFYINNFCFGPNPSDENQNAKLRQFAGLFTHKNVYYETDAVRSTIDADKSNIDILRQFFNGPAYTALNIDSTAPMVGTYADHVQALKWRDPNRPVLSMWGPWALGGTLGSGTENANNTLKRIDASDGYATDGPARLWAEDAGGYKGAEESAITYCHAKGKIASVMLAPFTCKGNAEGWLADCQAHVRYLEAHGADPEIYMVSYYAGQFEAYPVLPEANPDGSPAATITGVAFWLIHHLQDPVKWP